MSLFNIMKEPIVLKTDSSSKETLEKLKGLEQFLDDEGKDLLAQDIANLQYGILGEDKIEFELKNSHMPMYILHDIFVRDGDLEAQIDYIVVTRTRDYLIECKNLYGNIEINNNGDFIRTIQYGSNKSIREGIYSPVTQSVRHLNLLKSLHEKYRGKMIDKVFGIAAFYSSQLMPVVVLANSKTILDDCNAKEDIKKQVVRADRLIDFIRDHEYTDNDHLRFESAMKRRAEWYLSLDSKSEKDYTKKYEAYRKKETAAKAISPEKPQIEASENERLVTELRHVRYSLSQKDGVKPYIIFTDAQMKDLIAKMPTNFKELCKCDGFTYEKTGRYGKAILGILDKYR